MKNLFFFTFSFFYVSGLLAQVPLGQEQAIEEQNALALPQQEDSLSAIFSDPSEIEMIEGLDEPLERVKLRDQDTNLILDMIQAITGRYILRPQNLPQVKINFDSMNVLTKRETLLALESLLAMNGIGITKIDSQFYKAVPASGMNAHVPIWLDVPASSLPPSQRIYVKMFPLDYVPVEKMREILNPFATPNVSSLLIFPNSNSILITDSLLNLQRMEKIILRVDIYKEESKAVVQWYEPKRFSATALRDVFDKNWDAHFKNEFQVKPTFIIPATDDQLGYICHPHDTKKIKSYFEIFDIDTLFSYNSKLVPLYHADSQIVAEMLMSFKVGSGFGSKSRQKPNSPPTPTPNPTPQNSSGNSNVSLTEDAIYSEVAMAIPDERSNGIFLFGTPQDIEKMEKMIVELDTPLPMARIDTIFVMVDLSQANQRGIDALFQDLNWNDNEMTVSDTVSVDTDGDNIPDTDQTTTSTSGAKTLSGGLKVPFLNSGLEFQLENWKIQQIKWNQIFSLASKREDVRIFSTPSITVSHGEQKHRSGGDSYIRISDERSIGLPGVTMSNGQTSQPNVDKLLASTELRISNPRIRKTVRDPDTGEIIERGTVFISVTVMAEKFDTTTSNTYEGQSLPSKKGRTAVTDLAIRDGQIMVLGGFQEVQTDEEVSKYNILSEIPYLGDKLFSPSQKKITPTELMIFIKPTIIDPENPMDDFTNFNVNRIDSMMEPKYTPMFRSPSGKILGESEKKDSLSKQDNPSTKPSL
jgi:general secretion pathway protein D